MNRLASWFRIFSLVLLISSCQDHRIQPLAKRFRLTKIVETGGQLYMSGTFTYNSNNRITSFVRRLGSDAGVEKGPGQTTLVAYDAQGRVISTEEQVNEQYGTWFRKVYNYDGNGRVSLITIFVLTINGSVKDTSFVPNSTFAISYGENDLPVRIIFRAPSTTIIENYTYSGDNIVSAEQIDGSRRTIATYQYDDKLNPLYGPVGLLLFDYNDDVLSKNNKINPMKRLTYNSDGLLVSENLNFTSDLEGQRYIYYTYEAY